MHKILLTGSSGFIGLNIINSFSEKYKFYVIVRKKPKKEFLKKKKHKSNKIQKLRLTKY